MSQKYVTKRWNCPDCGNDGWSKDGLIPPHDTMHGKSCRPSGQVTDREAKISIARRVRDLLREIVADAETEAQERKGEWQKGWDECCAYHAGKARPILAEIETQP